MFYSVGFTQNLVYLEWLLNGFTPTLVNGRSQRVTVKGNLSQSLNLNCSVLHGSCFGPFLFTIYASKLFDVMRVYLPTAHCYIDDTIVCVFQPKQKLREIRGCHCYSALCG